MNYIKEIVNHYAKIPTVEWAPDLELCVNTRSIYSMERIVCKCDDQQLGEYLKKAIKQCDVGMVQLLAHQKCKNLNTQDVNGLLHYEHMYYKKYKTCVRTRLVCLAFKSGSVDIVNAVLQYATIFNDWNKALEYACMGGNSELIQMAISNGADNWCQGLLGACVGGHIDIQCAMADKSPNARKNYEFFKLCLNGLDISNIVPQLDMHSGTNSSYHYNWPLLLGMLGTCIGDHLDIFQSIVGDMRDLMCEHLLTHKCKHNSTLEFIRQKCNALF